MRVRIRVEVKFAATLIARVRVMAKVRARVVFWVWVHRL